MVVALFVDCAVGDRKLVVGFRPCCDLICASLVCEPFNLNILLVVLDTLRECIDEGVGCQSGRIGSDCRESGDDLVVNMSPSEPVPVWA